MQESSNSPRSKITLVSDSFTTSERRIAMALLTNYPEAGLQSVAAFAELAKVSSPTIIRFIRKIGYSQYVDFQKALRQDLVEFKYSPAQLLGRTAGDGLTQSQSATENVELLRDEILEAAKLLESEKSTVYVVGGIWSQPAAQYLANNLQRIRPNCSALTRDELTQAVTGAGRNTVFIVLDFRRYSEDTLTVMKLAHEKRAQLILITDRWISPISAMAKVILPVDIESAPFDSLVAPTVLAEALQAQLQQLLGPKSEQRIREFVRVQSALEELHSQPLPGSKEQGDQ